MTRQTVTPVDDRSRRRQCEVLNLGKRAVLLNKFAKYYPLYRELPNVPAFSSLSIPAEMARYLTRHGVIRAGHGRRGDAVAQSRGRAQPSSNAMIGPLRGKRAKNRHASQACSIQSTLVGPDAALLSRPAGPGGTCGPPRRCFCSLPSPPGARHSSRSRRTRPHRSRPTLPNCSGYPATPAPARCGSMSRAAPSTCWRTIPCSSSATTPVATRCCSRRCTRRFPSINELVSRHRELSFEELQAEVDVSVEILHRVIEHFKAQGKQVVVVGHSYGAFLTARYLWRKGPGAADRYLIMAGRLDMQREVVDGVLDGQYYYFADAVNPMPVPPYPVPITERGILELRIMGATGHDRYTERLAGTDLSRVLYVYGIEDMIVGRLTEDEVGFPTSSGSRVLAVQGGHVVDVRGPGGRPPDRRRAGRVNRRRCGSPDAPDCLKQG